MYNPLLMIDFYKATHAEQYPEGMTMIYSPYTPRMSRLSDNDQVCYFGGQGFFKEILIKAFNEYFFNRSEEDVMNEYTRIMDNTLGAGAYGSEKIRKLHRLGYLPITAYAVPEGTRTKVGVPQSVFVNTHPDFAWLPNALETVYSSWMWHIEVSAEVGVRYRKIVQKYHDLTCEDNVRVARLLGDFSMRGQHGHESAIHSSAAWLLSFLNTATVPAIMWLEDNYNCDCTKEEVGFGAISFEHSTVCSNFTIDGVEIALPQRALNTLYKNHNFSYVSDSYDYENFVVNIIPQMKDDILAHNGTFSVRGDSGNPVQVTTWTVFRLWEIFGGYINTKGYKVLDSHVRVIYGDSITPQRCEAIYEILLEQGFSIENVILGVGSFSFMCLEETSMGSDYNEYVKYNPYTRDTFGVAIKATYGECNGQPVMIQKQPRECSWKKSHKGCIIVSADGQEYTDGLTYMEAHHASIDNLLQPVFHNGKMMKEYSLADIRNRMYPEGF